MKKIPLHVLAAIVLWGVPLRAALAQNAVEVSSETPAAVSVDDVEKGALETLRDLATAYSGKSRSAFMKLVSDDFNGDMGALEDALLKDFRSYFEIDFDLIADRSVARGDQAAVDFHYNLALTDTAGTRQLYQGRSTYEFKMERGRMRLLRMERPILFGNTLTLAENPIALPQGSSPSNGGSAPGAIGSSAQTGSATVEKGVAGFRFLNGSAAPEPASDVYMFIGTAELAINPGGGLQSLGFGSLSSVTSVPANPTDQILSASVGELFVVKTLDGTYAVLRVSAITAATIAFDYKHQPNGSTSF